MSVLDDYLGVPNVSLVLSRLLNIVKPRLERANRRADNFRAGICEKTASIGNDGQLITAKSILGKHINGLIFNYPHARSPSPGPTRSI